jgi:hypothetical protein
MIDAVARTLKEHQTTSAYTPATDTRFTTTCASCGVLPDAPDVVFTHPAEMALMAAGVISPEYQR